MRLLQKWGAYLTIVSPTSPHAMDFWGIDRSRVSLRLKALERIGAADATDPRGDLEKLASVLESSTSASQPLYARELEVLVALTASAPKMANIQLLQPKRQLLVELLARLPTFEIVPGPGVRKTDASSPWTALARDLVHTLLLLGVDDWELESFTSKIEEMWNSARTDDQVLTVVFALYGFLEGLTIAPVQLLS